jgi:hypothetical protein
MAPGKKTPVNTEFYGSSLIIVTLITDFGGELGIRLPYFLSFITNSFKSTYIFSLTLKYVLYIRFCLSFCLRQGNDFSLKNVVDNLSF